MCLWLLNHREGFKIPSRCARDRRELIGKDDLRHFVELFPEDGLSGGSGV